MIQALSTPPSGKILLDANNTEIKIQSSNGEGYYFRAEIYINDILLDTQGWSRVDAYTAVKDLKKLYQAYFNPAFNTTFVPGLTEQSDLLRKVDITIKEYSLATGDLTGTLQLPSFNIMYNISPVAFSDTTTVRFLGVDPVNLIVPVDGKISIPLYGKVNFQSIKVTLATNLGTEIDSQQIGFSGKKVFLYNYNLGAYDIGSNIPYLKLTITCGFFTITKNIRILHNTAYPCREIAFRNNFGFYLYAYPFGEMETASDLDIQTYDTADKGQKVSEINEDENYTINSGALKSQERAIISMIAVSPDVKLNLGTGIGWADLLPKTKKITSFADRQHNYNDKLTFSLQKGTDVANTGFISVAPATPDIVITSNSVNGLTVTINYILNNGFTSDYLRLEYRVAGNTNWFQLGGNLSGGSVSLKTKAGTYSARIVDYNNNSNVSNVTTFTLS